jgi:hypothetical protein
MNDKIGKFPKIMTKDEALREIVYIANDKRGHILMEDHIKWMELKFKAINMVAKRGLKAKG